MDGELTRASLISFNWTYWFVNCVLILYLYTYTTICELEGYVTYLEVEWANHNTVCSFNYHTSRFEGQLYSTEEWYDLIVTLACIDCVNNGKPFFCSPLFIISINLLYQSVILWNRTKYNVQSKSVFFYYFFALLITPVSLVVSHHVLVHSKMIKFPPNLSLCCFCSFPSE